MTRPRSPQAARDKASRHAHVWQPFSSHWTSDHVYRNVFNASAPRHSLTPDTLTLRTDTVSFIFTPVPIFERTLIHVNCPTIVFLHRTILLSLYHYALFFMAC